MWDVDTAFGTVRVYRFEGGPGRPVVLLPGRNASTPMWADNLPGLLAHRPVYCVDLLGEPGMSVQRKPITGAAAVPVLTQRLKDHAEFEDAIFSTGLNAEDFTQAAGYKRAAFSDDPVLWQQAREFLQRELNWLETEKMGLRPADGKPAFEAHDPGA